MPVASQQEVKERYELQAIFDLSKVLNSSLNLKKILDTLLLTLMGKFLIVKGVVLVTHKEQEFVIEASKGLPRSLIGTRVPVESLPVEPSQLSALSPSAVKAFLAKYEIELLLPIRHDDKELAIVGLSKKSLGGNFSDIELDYLNSLAHISAAAIQNGLIFRQLDEAKRRSDKRVQELNTLSEIVRELNSTLSTLKSDRVLSLLAYSIMGEMMVNRCLVFLADDEGMNLLLNKGVAAEKVEPLLKRDILAQIQALDKALAITQDSNSLAELFRLAGMAALVPMCVENETKGMVALGPKITKQPFSDDDLNFLTILGNWSVISIETARLIEQEFEKKALEEELRIASDIQKQLLPNRCPELEAYDIAGANTPSRQIGGDYYDCIQVSGHEYIFCIADVSGKGAPAALLMSNLQASLRALVGTELQLTEIVGRINNIIYSNTTYDKFITFFFGLLDLENNTFTSVNAGHNPPYLYHQDGQFQTFDEGGLILGMMPDVPYTSETVTLKPGDCIVMFTDGVSEAMNMNDEEFEEYRIEKCIADNLQNSASHILNTLIEEVRTFSSGRPQSDDITALVLKAK